MKWMRWMALLCGVCGSLPALAAEKPQTWVSVRDYGAICNGRNNDTEAFNRAIAAARQVFIPAGDCIVDGVVLTSDTELYGEGDASALYVPVEARWGLSVNPGAGGSASTVNNARNIYLHHFLIKGAVEVAGFSEHRHLLNLNAVSDLTIDQVTFRGFRGDAVYVGSSNTPGLERHNERIVIRNSRFDGINGANRNAVSIIDVDGLLVENSLFENMTRPDMPGAIDLEPNSFAFHRIRNVVIRGNAFRNIGGNGGAVTMYYPTAVTAEPNSIEVSGNRFENIRSNAIMFYRVKAPTAQSPFHQILVADNEMVDCARPFSLFGIKGISILDNRFRNCGGAALIGYTGAEHLVQEVTLENNQFEQSAVNDNACLVLFSVDAVSLRGNRFADCARSGAPGFAVAFNVGRSSGLEMIGNQFINAQGRLTHAVQVDVRHRLSMESNRFENNQIDPSLRIDQISNRPPGG